MAKQSIPQFFDHDLSIKEFSHEFSVSSSTIYLMITDGQIETYKVRGATRIKRESADALRAGVAA